MEVAPSESARATHFGFSRLVKSMDILCEGIWFWSSSEMPGPCTSMLGGRGMPLLRRASAFALNSLKEWRGATVLPPVCSRKLPRLAERNGRMGLLLIKFWFAAMPKTPFGTDGCSIGLCVS